MGRVPKVNRNDPCPCGSGRKFKRCCEAKTSGRRVSLLMLLTIGGAMVGALLLGLSSLGDDAASPTAPGRVWSAEHGHWHDR